MELILIISCHVLFMIIGAALPSLICALANAYSVTITDHPSSPALKGAIQFNMAHNIHNDTNASTNTNTNNSTTNTDTDTDTTIKPTQLSIHPHEWGNISDPFAMANKGKFTRIIAADCYWMMTQHENLCTSLDWFLAPGGKVWVVSSFHTGRAVVGHFFDTAIEFGFVIERIWERDLVKRDCGRERRRSWRDDGYGDEEGGLERRRWCVVAVLKRG